MSPTELSTPACRPPAPEVTTAGTPDASKGGVWRAVACLFDAEWYAARYTAPSMAQTAMQHYLEAGMHLGHQPNPLFDPAWYARTYGCSEQLAVLDYLFGATDGPRSPSALFDSGWYLFQHPDVKAAGPDAFVHYVNFGRHEGRVPSPLLDESASSAVAEEMGAQSVMLEVPQDFRASDLAGYWPDYVTLSQLLAGAAASSFFKPEHRHAVLLPSPSHASATRPASFESAAVIGGRPEVVVEDRIVWPQAEERDRGGARMMRVRHRTRPRVEVGVSLLGWVPAAGSQLDAVATAIGSACRHLSGGPLPTLLLDESLESAVTAHLRDRFAGRLNALVVEADDLVGVDHLMLAEP